MTGLVQKIDHAARHASPVIITCMLIIVDAVPVGLPYFGNVSPSFTVMAVFYWTMRRPDLFPPVAAFGIGVLNDIINGSLIGLSALIFLTMHWVITSQIRLFRSQPFLLVWCFFLPVVLIATLLQWIIISALDFQVMPVRAVMVHALLTAAFYPIIAWLMVKVERSFLHVSDA